MEKIRRILLTAFLGLAVSSCMTQSADSQADSQLGLTQSESSGEADEALGELRDELLDERQRYLERQATDPSFETSDITVE